METISREKVLREACCFFLDGFRGRIVILSMLVAMMLSVVACTPNTTNECVCVDKSNFPTGRFVREDNDKKVFEFDEDGTWRYYEYNLTAPLVSGKYGITGDLYTEMTHNYSPDRKIPATYTWTYDGQKLTFQLVGEDILSHRKTCYDGVTYIKDE